MDKRRGSLWVWIVAILVFLPVGYVLLFGPAVRVMLRRDSPGMLPRAAYTGYKPLAGAMYDGPGWVSGPLLWYACLFLDQQDARHLRQTVETSQSESGF